MRLRIAATVVTMATFCAVGAQTGTPAPPKVWTGSMGAGLALAGGNTDTLNLNLSFDATRDPKSGHVMKFVGLWLRGESNDVTDLDRLTFSFRDELDLSARTFFFSEMAYLRDRFKDIDYLLSPKAGLGYKVYNTDALKLSVDGGAGAIWEKNPGLDVESSGSLSSSQRLSWRISESAELVQSVSGLWEVDDLADSLYQFTISIATAITSNSRLKVEFNDVFKNRPPGPDIKKNDTALITAFVYKF